MASFLTQLNAIGPSVPPWLIPLILGIALVIGFVVVLSLGASRKQDISRLPRALGMQPAPFNDEPTRQAALESLFTGSLLFLSEYLVSADTWLRQSDAQGVTHVVRISGYPVPGQRRGEEAQAFVGRKGYAETTETFVVIEPVLPPGLMIPRFLLVPNNFIVNATDSKREVVTWSNRFFARRNRVSSRQPGLMHRAFSPQVQRALIHNRSLSIEGVDDRALVFSRYGSNLSTHQTVELLREARTLTQGIVAGLSRQSFDEAQDAQLAEV